jgi:hypothetical protein
MRDPYLLSASHQNDMSLTNVILLLGFYSKETAEIHSNLNCSTQQLKRHTIHISHAVFLQYYVGTCKNNTNPKIILDYKSGCKIC